MRKVHEKSIVLGIGIGMIITAIAGMIFSAGNQKELSKAEIISLAKGYGLVEKVGFLDGTNATIDSTDENTSAEETTANSSTAENTAANDSGTDNSETTDIPQQGDSDPSTTASTITDRNISVEIKDGFKSQQVIEVLLKKAVITNEEDFKGMLDSYKASTKIRTGTFMFKKNEDLNYIVKTICKFK